MKPRANKHSNKGERKNIRGKGKKRKESWTGKNTNKLSQAGKKLNKQTNKARNKEKNKYRE